jgi:hypothetical protein
LQISDVSKGNPNRLGVDGPRNLDRINVRIFAVDCRDVDWTDLGEGRHQYYRLRPEVIEDVSAILSKDAQVSFAHLFLYDMTSSTP